MYTPRTLVALDEATIRQVRSGRDAFASAALGARMSPGKKSSVYMGPKGEYSYGIESQSTGGKSAPKGFRRVGEITPGTGGSQSTPVLKRADSKARMKQQMDRIAQSLRLSDEEKKRYMAAAQKQKGRVALPGGAQAAMKQTTYGVDPRRKTAPGLQKQPRTMGAMQRAVDAARQAAGAVASRIFGRRRRQTA